MLIQNRHNKITFQDFYLNPFDTTQLALCLHYAAYEALKNKMTDWLTDSIGQNASVSSCNNQECLVYFMQEKYSTLQHNNTAFVSVPS